MKSEKLTSFALMIAAIALLIVGAKSYNDYLRGKFEKEFGVAAAGSQSQPQSPAGSESGARAAAAVEALPPARTPGDTVEAAPLLPPPTPEVAPVAPAVPPAPDPRISQYQEDLENLRRENSRYRERLEAVTLGTTTGGDLADSFSTPPGPDPGLAGDPGRPASAVAATGAAAAAAAAAPPNPGSPATGPIPTGNPSAPPSRESVNREVSAMVEKIRKEASVAKVIEYDPDWAFVVLDGGRNRGIQQEMRFAVRRGGEILGFIKVTEVELDRAVAELMSANKNSQTARKPAPGDDIIAYNLF